MISRRRTLDLVVALTALALLLPVLVLVGCAVRVRLGRPVFFRQRRAGRHGSPFLICKFRTMTTAVDGSGRPLPDAERMTRFGRVLRATSLDELPELWNVVRGEMSLVGPRPLLVDYVERFTPRQARRLELLPGITGWAQIHGRNALSWDERLELDVWYVEQRRLRLDLWILAATPWAVIRARGIHAPGEVTMHELPRRPDAHSR